MIEYITSKKKLNPLVLRETLDLCNDVINFIRKIYGQN